ncbi:BMP family ABC transporter substrate-binding protein [Paraburkholderia sp. HD33-4]|uniref:BMP family ABC transporter substrate-binding protein n=1 Tax=Paraburkholderia sp. HD33-4 TaxID=2883242 RepID=UPI001F3B70DB|nr:BMP family ABC transporter substrate-binding protein [Paraburkholderia sp. HD33-4]
MKPHPVNERRRFVCSLLALSAFAPTALRGATHASVAGTVSTWPVLLFIPYGGSDLGFSEAAYRGYLQVRRSGYRITVVRDADSLGAARILTIIGRHYKAGVRGFILAGAELSAVTATAAAQYPQAYFATLSGTANGPNVVNFCLDCKSLGGALAGAVAANVSKTKTVGFVGGVESVDGTEAQSFRQAVLAKVPDATVLVDWVGDWDNRRRTQQLTGQQIDAGADVVVADANDSVIVAAARHPSVRVIGWMADASRRHGNVAASVIIDTSVIFRRFVDGVVAGQFEGGDYTVVDADHVWKIVWPRR